MASRFGLWVRIPPHSLKRKGGKADTARKKLGLRPDHPRRLRHSKFKQKGEVEGGTRANNGFEIVLTFEKGSFLRRQNIAHPAFNYFKKQKNEIPAVKKC